MRGIVASFIVLATVAGCGSSGDGSDVPYRPFDPGMGKPGNYGSGSGGGGDGGTLPTVCAESERRCAHTFTYAGSPALPLGTEASVELIGDYRAGAWTKGDALMFNGTQWTVTVPVPWNTQVIYKFHLVMKDATEKYIADPANAIQVDDGFGGKNSVLTAKTCAMWTCVPPGSALSCPGGAQGGFDWRDAVMYFVFVDRFFDGNAANNFPVSAAGLNAAANWQGGDWAGVTQKLKAGYFQTLGVNTLWLSVPMDNSDGSGIGDDGMLYSAYHAYWPRNLGQTERRFGTDAELKTLVDEAHKLGMKVLIDYAMNHVHKDSPVYMQHTNDGWFNPLKVGGQDCICGTATCPWDGPTGKVCWFRDYLPDFNFGNAQARAFSVQNAIDWITSIGFDGYRLDAIKHVELSWLTELKSRLIAEIEPTSKQHVYLVGETFTGDRALIKSFIDPCKMLDGQFDFPLRASLDNAVLARQGKMKDLIDFMDGNTAAYGSAVMSTFIGNHDVPRSIHFAQDTPLWSDIWTAGKDRSWTGQPALVGGTSAYERMAVAMAILMTNRGVPLIYYGDEVGMPGAGDPDNRRFMQWSGYSAGQTLLYQRMQKLGALRTAHPALRRGDRTTLSFGNDTWAYQLLDGADRVYVLVNRSDTTQSVSGLPTQTLKDEVSGEMVTGPAVSMPPRSFRILPAP
jgi:glycosidase